MTSGVFQLATKRLPRILHRRFTSGSGHFRAFKMGSSWSQTSNGGQSIIPPADTITVDTAKDPTSRRLTYLLKANHINHAILFNHLKFVSHIVHILGSAYAMGSTPEHLTEIYDEESKTLVPWEDSPGEIAPHDWKTHLGDKLYQRAFLDFFEDEMVQRGYDWKATVMHYLLDGEQPLMNGLVDGLGHPLIHLAYAFELDNREVAMEALTMAAVEYGPLHQFIDDPNPPTPYETVPDILSLLTDLRQDGLFDGKFDHAGQGNSEELLGPMVMQLWLKFNSLILKKEELAMLFENQVDAAVLVFTTGQKKGDPQYDFFLLHLVTTAHALRILLPLMSIQQAWHLIRAHVVLFVLTYLTQCRPLIKKELLEEVDIEGKDWDYIKKKALGAEARFDAHYVKGLRAFMEFEKYLGNKDNFYLKAAVKFADEFKDWTGFAKGDPELDIKK